jgi:hypothetical protein
MYKTNITTQTLFYLGFGKIAQENNPKNSVAILGTNRVIHIFNDTKCAI